jgi:hypothetical protein
MVGPERFELSPQLPEGVDSGVKDGGGHTSDAQPTAHGEAEALGQPEPDTSGYDPDAIFELLPPLGDSGRGDDLDPELREFVSNWPNLDRDIKLIILGLARPWRGDGS